MNMDECRILLVDDETDILKMNQEFLLKKGFKNVDVAMNGEKANVLVAEQAYQLVVLDIMMPGMDGLSLYESWIRRGISVPVIFLSAKDEEWSRLKGLGLGADDYITKPYTLEELYLRIKGILRRTYRITENKMIRLGSTEVDLLSGIVINRDKKYVLTAKEYALFSKLYDNKGKIVSMNA